MQHILLVIIIGVIILSIFRMIRKKSYIPNNKYTPLDDINNGLMESNKSDPLSIESKSEIKYE
ncbi:hypothetical protein JOC75_000942 [Metabacillus crassostreae]|uniref:hypothetical protein n=1 Tax=Metabacillus crassostreae TaxID=929098 RepID=UPI001958BEB6|nr:hypothetical protein [Metabacillus crassostreae]MBM7602972.1 hypothetical protein [Metabacillus crassostreae]